MKDDLKAAPALAERWLLGVLGSLTVVTAVLFTMIMVWTVHVDGSGGPRALGDLGGQHTMWPWALVATIGAAMLLIAELMCLRHRLISPQHPHVIAGSPTLRSIAIFTVVTAMLLLLPSWNLLGVVPLGAVVGAELTIRRGCRIDSMPPRARRTERVLRVGFVSAMLLLPALGITITGAVRSGAPVVADGLSGPGITITMLAMVVIAGAAAAAVHGGLCHLGHKMAQEATGYLVGVRRSHLQQRAQWVHDQLLSEVSFMIMELESRPQTDEWALGRLRDLDHRLRVEQIGDLIESGPTRIASLIQLHIRRSVHLGVTVSPIPQFDQVDVMVDTDTGRLINRVLSTLFSNAMNAGAQEIGLDVRVEPAGVEIRVSDDAGGVDLHTVPAGRGLEDLISILGSTGVSREPVPGGSLMKVVVPHRLILEVIEPELVPVAGFGLRRWSR